MSSSIANCLPSRASLLTGRWPHHAHQWNVDPPTSKLGLNLNMTTLPSKLKQAGYATHMVGKWHEGFATTDYLPINRGFDSSSGFLNGGEDHMHEVIGCAVDFGRMMLQILAMERMMPMCSVMT